MKMTGKTATILLFVSLAVLPLFATSNYAITETERGSSPTSLDIFHENTSHISSAQKGFKTRTRSILPKVIYLTFDDGPSKGTANVLSVLKEEGVEGTMFFIGRNIEYQRSLYAQALSMPNLLIANHTYSHANGKYARFYSSAATVVNDVDRAQRIIGGAKYLRLAGRNVWRLPSLYRNDYALSKTRRKIESPKYTALSDRGYQIYGWDIEWHFDHATGNASYGADRMADRIETLCENKRLAKEGKIVLLAHDYMFRKEGGRQKLRELIQILKASGWRFETLGSYGSSTPAVFVQKKKRLRKKVIRLAMNKRDPVRKQRNKRKRLLLLR